ncbi:MAG: toprim domain-containing protein [Microcoleus sp.]
MTTSKFIGSGKRLPCPVCGRDKDDKCRIGDEGKLILCGTEVNSRKPKDIYNGFVYLGESESGVWGKWVPDKEDWVKERPSGVEFRYPFYDKNGNKIVDEVRTYNGQSKKQTWMDPSGVNTSVLLPYRYTEAIAALKNGAEQVLILEGPPKADMAWELGIPAVAFANGFKPSRDKHWFQGFESRIVLVPDQDLPGLKKVAAMHAAYPMSRQWRPWPDSARWAPEWISDKGGLDFLDWVQQLKEQGYGDEEIAALVKPETNGHGAKVNQGELGELDQVGNEDAFSKVKINLTEVAYDKIVDSMVCALSTEERYLKRIYVQGTSTGEKWVSRILTNADGSVRMIDALDPDKAHVEIEKRFSFRKNTAKNNDVISSCPDRIAKSFVKEGQWQKLMQLDRVARMPLLRWDGTITETPGYYKEEKIILSSNIGTFNFHPTPNELDAHDSLRFLKHFLREFHFKDLLGVSNKLTATSVDRSSAIAAILTAVSRHMYDYAPCFITNAHTPGSGKGTLASVITIIQTGRAQSERTWNPEPIELEKVIVSELLNQPSSLIFGNIDSRFGGSIIESLLTKPEYPGRILGASKMVFPSTKTLVMANGNNLTISRDMVRRSILTRLDCGVERPQDIDYEVKDIFSHAKQARGLLFPAAITILQAFMLSKEMDESRSKLNGFEAWDRLVRGALLWLGEADPVKSQQTLEEDDEEGILLGRFIDSCLTVIGTEFKTFSELRTIAEKRDSSGRLIAPNDFIEVFYEVCYNPKSKEYCQTKFGRFVNKLQGQVKNGHCIEKGTGRSRRHFGIKKML